MIEVKTAIIMIVAFTIIVVLPAIGILLFLDKKDPKRKKATFLTTPKALYFFSYPIKPWLFTSLLLVVVGLSWFINIRYLPLLFLIIALLTVRRKNK